MSAVLNDAIDAARARLRDAWEAIPPEDRDIAERCMRAAADVAARGLFGEDVTEDVAQVRSQASSLAAATREIVIATVFEAIGAAGRKILVGALAGVSI